MFKLEVLKEILDLLVLQVQLVHRENKDLKEIQVNKVLLVLSVLLVHREKKA